MKKLIMLSAPPRAGKDTFYNVAACLDSLKYVRLSFAEELKRLTHAALGIEKPPSYFEEVKDESVKCFYDKTPREAYIAFSENFMKPLAGKDVWGKIIYDRIEKAIIDFNETVIITDLGFKDEAEYICSQKITKEEIAIVHIYRPGTDFSKDSRNYVEIQGVKTFHLDNPGEGYFEKYVENIKNLLAELSN